VEIEKLGIEGAWFARSPVHSDSRGSFREWFKSTDVENAIGRSFEVVQSNISYSGNNVLRGIHYSMAPSGQGKWITCLSGSIWDVVVDIRPNSPTYKKWLGFTLDGTSGDALFISEGLGHGFLSLENNSIVSYLLTSPYSPLEEYEINPLDPELGITWPRSNFQMSPKDSGAPTMNSRKESGQLPSI
jgi:dTDP-4-dehydrorhamnose 3,5-epimerase